MRLLITGAFQKDTSFFDEVSALGHKITYVQDERISLLEQGIDPAAFDGVICNGLFQYTPIEQFTKLRMIQLTSTGYDRVPMEYIQSHHIALYNARDVYSVPMAEFALCGVLMLYKRIHFFADHQRNHIWEKQRELLELCGKTVCIIGCGSVGTECAKRFKAFGCRVVGVNRTAKELACFDQILPLTYLDEALPYADVVVLSISLTEETRYLMDTRRFALLRDGAVLVNVARGALLNEQALLAWLQSGRSGGCALDVFETEPLEESSLLWGMEHAILTPHCSFAGDHNCDRLHEVILKNLLQQ